MVTAADHTAVVLASRSFMQVTGRRVTAMAISALLALAVCEVALRYTPGIFDDSFATFDDEVGWRLRPGFAGWMSEENQLWVQINRDGWRDVEHPLRAADGVVRIAVLGDSYVEGIGLPREQGLTTVLERELRNCAPQVGDLEVLNFGVSGYGTIQEERAFTTYVRHYAPQLVLLAVYTGNDIHNNHPRLNPSELRDVAPYYRLVEGRLELDPSFRAAIRERSDHPWWRRARIAITDRFRVAQLVYDTYGRVREARGPAGTDAAEERDPLSIYAPPSTADMAEAWTVTESVIARLRDEVEASGAEFWVVTLANREQTDPDLSARVDLARQRGVADLFYPDDRLEAFGAARGMNILTLARPLADATARSGHSLHGGFSPQTPPGTGHRNAAAHRLCLDSATIAAHPRANARSPRGRDE